MDESVSEPQTTVWYLKRNRIFARVDENVLEGCDHLFTVCEHPRRTRLFDQGDPSGLIYFLKRGRVRLSRLTEDGKEITIAMLGPRDLFGEEPIFGDATRTTIATCIEDSLVCTTRADQLFPLLTRHPAVTLNIAKYLKEQRDEAATVIEDLAYLKVSDRIVKLFERLALEHGVLDTGGTRIDVRLTHNDIASLVGSTRETVSLEMSKLQRDGRILIRDRAVILPIAQTA